MAVDWKARAERLEAELVETKENLQSLITISEIMQQALWPHEELEIHLNPGTKTAPPVIGAYREFMVRISQGSAKSPKEGL